MFEFLKSLVQPDELGTAFDSMDYFIENGLMSMNQDLGIALIDLVGGWQVFREKSVINGKTNADHIYQTMDIDTMIGFFNKNKVRFERFAELVFKTRFYTGGKKVLIAGMSENTNKSSYLKRLEVEITIDNMKSYFNYGIENSLNSKKTYFVEWIVQKALLSLCHDYNVHKTIN